MKREFIAQLLPSPWVLYDIVAREDRSRCTRSQGVIEISLLCTLQLMPNQSISQCTQARSTDSRRNIIPVWPSSL